MPCFFSPPASASLLYFCGGFNDDRPRSTLSGGREVSGTPWGQIIPQHKRAAVEQILLAIVKLQVRSKATAAKELASIAATAVGLLAAEDGK